MNVPIANVRIFLDVDTGELMSQVDNLTSVAIRLETTTVFGATIVALLIPTEAIEAAAAGARGCP